MDWIKTELIPFIKTRSILNSFNSGREVKISRDGAPDFASFKSGG